MSDATRDDAYEAEAAADAEKRARVLRALEAQGDDAVEEQDTAGGAASSATANGDGNGATCDDADADASAPAGGTGPADATGPKWIRGGENGVALDPKQADRALVGRRVRVWWEDDSAWFVGTVRAFDAVTQRHTIVYDDGDQQQEALQPGPNSGAVCTWELMRLDLPSQRLRERSSAASKPARYTPAPIRSPKKLAKPLKWPAGWLQHKGLNALLEAHGVAVPPAVSIQEKQAELIERVAEFAALKQRAMLGRDGRGLPPRCCVFRLPPASRERTQQQLGWLVQHRTPGSRFRSL